VEGRYGGTRLGGMCIFLLTKSIIENILIYLEIALKRGISTVLFFSSVFCFLNLKKGKNRMKRKIKKEIFGPHLMLDLSKCNAAKLRDYNLIFRILHELPEKIGMTRITEPYVFPYSGLIPEDKGITGTVIIAESHISIHTFQEKDYCFVDVFSCKNFDVEYAAEYLINVFESKKFEKNIVNRGKDFVRFQQPQEVFSC
jgi:S-adenosylmethionine decarboxylase